MNTIKCFGIIAAVWVLLLAQNVLATKSHEELTIFGAIKNHDYNAVKNFLDNGTNINEMRELGITPLMDAVQFVSKSDDIEIIKLLIDRGANVNAVDEDNRSPLFFVEGNESSAIIKLLCNADVNPDIQANYISQKGHTALIYYIEKYGTRKKINEKSEGNNLETLLQEIQVLVETLVEDTGFDLHVKNGRGKTAYDLAIQHKLDNVVNYLKPLIEFDQINNKSKITNLYSDSVPLKIRQRIFCWLLNYALRKKDENLKILFDFYAKSLTNNKFSDIYHSISEKCDKAKLHLLKKEYEQALEKEKKQDPSEGMFNAIQNGDLEKVKKLLDNGFDVNFRYEKNRTPLLLAIDANQKEIAAFVIEKGADLDIQNDAGITALLWAIYKGYPDLAQMIIQKKANLNLQNEDGETALMEAIATNQPAIVHLLIQEGVQVNLKDKKMRTALHKAVIDELSDIVKILMNTEIDSNIQDDKGFTALHWAALKNNQEIVELLTIHGNAQATIKDNRGKIAAEYAKKNSKIKTYLQILARYQENSQRARNENTRIKHARYDL